jgi:hypothetical protein
MARSTPRTSGWITTGAMALAAGVVACSGGSLPASTPDASREEADAAQDATGASREQDDATTAGSSDATSAGDGANGAHDSSEDGADAACANASVPPATLDCTGLYVDIASKTLSSAVRSYQPAVPLWSDGAQKMRWIQLPAGTQIDVSDPNEWSFPVGTKIWKEFSRGGKRIETRLFQKIDDGPPPIWVHATYAWNEDESEAVTSGGGDITLADDGGIYHIPTFAECEECHNGRTDHVLGFEQVSLGEQGALGLTLAELAAEALIAPTPAQTQLTIGEDSTGVAAPALAWLHVNCGVTCHNANSNATAYGVGMRLRLDPALLDGRPVTISAFDPLSTTIGVAARSPGWVQPVAWTRIVPGDPAHSLLVQLISNRGTNNPVGGQMPPIASLIVDTADVANVVAWISKMPVESAGDGGLEGGAEGAGDLDGGSDAEDGLSGDAADGAM